MLSHAYLLFVELVDAAINEVPQECDQEANVGHVEEARPQQPPPQHSAPAGANAASSGDDAASRSVEPDHDVQMRQRVETEVVNEPPEPVQHRTEKRAVSLAYTARPFTLMETWIDRESLG